MGTRPRGRWAEWERGAATLMKQKGERRPLRDLKELYLHHLG